jgi:hypothetical protein
MPTLTEILARLAVVPTTVELLGLAATAGLIVAVTDWRASVFALIVQYVLAGLLLTHVIPPEIAAIKTLTGAMICVVLYITARRAGWGRLPLAASPDEEPPSRFMLVLILGLPFRIMAALMGLALAYSAVLQMPLANVPLEVSFGVFTLGMMGILGIALADEPFKGGLALLTVITGFDLFYSSIVQSLTVVGFLGVINFMIALATASLTTAHAASLAASQQEENNA